MKDIEHMSTPSRRPARRGQKVRRVLGAVVQLGLDYSRDDIRTVVRNGKLFLGMTFFVVGLFSFVSDRYCDGNVASYYACTRPATYYYYPWWAVILVLVGVTLVTLWFLQRRPTRA